MPYLPPPFSETTVIPIPLGKDFALQVRLASAKWKRFFPLLHYRPLAKAVTMQPSAPGVTDGAVPVGETGTTAFDPLYGETVDPQMIVDGAWRQPHLSADLHAVDPEVYEDDVEINMRIFVDSQDSELHLWGFEKNLGIIAVVPASILDEVEVTAKAGDIIVWAGDMYEVLQLGPPNRWLNTSTALYIALNCQTKRRGS